jgi:hypothetical protein
MIAESPLNENGHTGTDMEIFATKDGGKSCTNVVANIP